MPGPDLHVGAICTLDSLSLLLGTVYILSFLVLGMGGVLLLPLGTGDLSLLKYLHSEPLSDCVPVTGGGCGCGCSSSEAADRDCGCLEL